MTLQGSTTVVTGAGDGLGRAVATAFADAGATVVIGARDGDAVAATVDALESRLEPGTGTGTGRAAENAGPTAAGVRTDVRDEFDLERLAETASRTGANAGIDVVVPAAGVSHGEPGSTPLHRESYSAFDDHWRVNGRGVFATIRESLAHLNDGARVLVPTESAAREADPGDGSYGASRATAAAVARGFAADTDYVVGCLDVGSAAREDDDGILETVAEAFVRAATETPAAELDGRVVDVAPEEAPDER